MAYLESVTKHVDSVLPVDTLYLDFAKAFDNVHYSRLLIKLKAHGIDGDILEWIRRWLTDRKQRVILNGGTSDWLPVLSGVPQGTVFILNIYINYIDLNISGEMLKFADDTKVIDKLLNWSNIWQVQFNIEKCRVMHFVNNNPCFEYTMGETKLTLTK